MTELSNILVKSKVSFDPEKHEYRLGSLVLHGITSTIVHRAFPDKYAGVSDAVLQEAARRGTELHEQIELYDTFGGLPTNKRLEQYQKMKDDRGLTVLANEYLVSDEQYYATAIDIVMADASGGIHLVDIKTTRQVYRDSVRVQLTMCKRLFEVQNPGLKVASLQVLWIPAKPEGNTICQMSEIPAIEDGVLDALIEADQNDEPFDYSATMTSGTLPVVAKKVETEIALLDAQLKEAQGRMKVLKERLLELMRQYDVKSFESERLKLTRVLPTVARVFDEKTFKTEHEDLYEKYMKSSERGDSLRITIKERVQSSE